MNLIKDIIVDALSCAADNAHDMGIEDCDAYAVGVITIEIVCGDGDERIDCGYFEGALLNAGLEEDGLTRAECKPHLTWAIYKFMNSKTVIIRLTEEDANALEGVITNWIDQFEDVKLSDCEHDSETAKVWMPMYRAACKVFKIIHKGGE